LYSLDHAYTRRLGAGVIAFVTLIFCIIVIRRTFLDARRWTSKRLVVLLVRLIYVHILIIRFLAFEMLAIPSHMYRYSILFSTQFRRSDVCQIAGVQCLLSTVHYFFLDYIEVALTMQLLSVAVYLYEGYFFGTIAIAIFKRHYFLDTMMRPVMVGIFVVLTGLCLWSMFGREGLTCRDASWLTFICAQWYEISTTIYESQNCIYVIT
jgi:hypothetical protein